MWPWRDGGGERMLGKERNDGRREEESRILGEGMEKKEKKGKEGKRQLSFIRRP